MKRLTDHLVLLVARFGGVTCVGLKVAMFVLSFINCIFSLKYYGIHDIKYLYFSKLI